VGRVMPAGAILAARARTRPEASEGGARCVPCVGECVQGVSQVHCAPLMGGATANGDGVCLPHSALPATRAVGPTTAPQSRPIGPSYRTSRPQNAGGWAISTSRYLPLPPHTTPFHPVSEILRGVSEILRETQSPPSMFPTIEAG
jgi:hypothetical protein